MYAKDISKKIKSVKRDKQRQGLFIGGKAPYGYTLSPERKNALAVDPEAAEVVKLIFRTALAGKSSRQIAAELNERGVPPPAVYAGLPAPRKGPYSGLWSAERVAHILKNRMYVGDMVQGTTRRVNYKSKKCVRLPEEEWVIVEGTHPAIVDRADFETVRRLLGSRSRTRARTYDHLLKGLIFCKECGYPLGVINRGGPGGEPALYFVCRTYQRFTKARLCTCHCVRVEAVAEAVVGRVKALCRQYTGAFGEIAADVVGDTAAGKDAEMRRLSGQIAGIASGMDKLYADKLSGLLDDVDFRRFYARLRDERSALRERLDRLGAAGENGKPVCDIDGLTERFIESAERNRELLCGLIERIELTADKEVHIHFRFGGLLNSKTSKDPS